MPRDQQEYSRKYYLANRDKILKRSLEYQKRNRKAANENGKRYYERNKERLKPVINARSRASYRNHAEERRAYAVAYRAKLKEELFAAYTDYCNCCGEKERAFLTLEHSNRDGKHHRLTVGHTLARQIVDLRKRGWPKEGYEILCFNCNRASWELGVCPHRQRKILAEQKEKATI